MRASPLAYPSQQVTARVKKGKENGRAEPRGLEPVFGTEKDLTLRSLSGATLQVEHEQRDSLWEGTADPALWLKE